MAELRERAPWLLRILQAAGGRSRATGGQGVRTPGPPAFLGSPPQRGRDAPRGGQAVVLTELFVWLLAQAWRDRAKELDRILEGLAAREDRLQREVPKYAQEARRNLGNDRGYNGP